MLLPPSFDALDADVVAFQAGPGGGELIVEPTARWGRFTLHLLVFLAVALLAAPTLGGATVAKRGRE